MYQGTISTEIEMPIIPNKLLSCHDLVNNIYYKGIINAMVDPAMKYPVNRSSL